jgi:hypothetical protein
VEANEMALVFDEGSLELLEELPISTSSQPNIKLLYPISVVRDDGDSVYVYIDAEGDDEDGYIVLPSQGESQFYE